MTFFAEISFRVRYGAIQAGKEPPKKNGALLPSHASSVIHVVFDVRHSSGVSELRPETSKMLAVPSILRFACRGIKVFFRLFLPVCLDSWEFKQTNTTTKKLCAKFQCLFSKHSHKRLSLFGTNPWIVPYLPKKLDFSPLHKQLLASIFTQR